MADIGGKVISGSFNQGHLELFPNSSGKQCVPNSFTSIMLSKIKPFQLWQQHDLDSIIMNGDILYSLVHHSFAAPCHAVSNDFIPYVIYKGAYHNNNKIFTFQILSTLFNCFSTEKA